MAVFTFTKPEQEMVEPPRGGIAESGLYEVLIEKVYISKNPSTGSEQLQIEMKSKDDRQMYSSHLLRSGDEKGNKDHFVNQQGNKVPFDAVNILTKICRVKDECKDINTIEWNEVSMERFGQQEKVVAAKMFSGMKCIVVFQQFENFYQNELKIKSKIVQFIELGNNELEAKWTKWIEKYPLKEDKKKNQVSNTPQATGGSEDTSSLNNW
jgi:hypothetical protein